MENKKSKFKVLEGQHVLSAEFFSQVVDSMPDYSIFTLGFFIRIWGVLFFYTLIIT